jgi:hypothetical protein
MRYTIFLLLLGTAACLKAPEDITETGPTIVVRLEPTDSFGTSASSDSSFQALSIDSSTNTYSFNVLVEADTGEKAQGSTYTHPTVMTPTATLTVPGVTIPDSPFDESMQGSLQLFTRHDTVSFSGALQGQVLVVHAIAMDANGLASNVVDMNVMLR